MLTHSETRSDCHWSESCLWGIQENTGTLPSQHSAHVNSSLSLTFSWMILPGAEQGRHFEVGNDDIYSARITKCCDRIYTLLSLDRLQYK